MTSGPRHRLSPFHSGGGQGNPFPWVLIYRIHLTLTEAGRSVTEIDRLHATRRKNAEAPEHSPSIHDRNDEGPRSAFIVLIVMPQRPVPGDRSDASITPNRLTRRSPNMFFLLTRRRRCYTFLPSYFGTYKPHRLPKCGARHAAESASVLSLHSSLRETAATLCKKHSARGRDLTFFFTLAVSSKK